MNDQPTQKPLSYYNNLAEAGRHEVQQPAQEKSLGQILDEALIQWDENSVVTCLTPEIAVQRRLAKLNFAASAVAEAVKHAERPVVSVPECGPSLDINYWRNECVRARAEIARLKSEVETLTNQRRMDQ